MKGFPAVRPVAVALLLSVLPHGVACAEAGKAGSSDSTELIWHWEDEFSDAEQKMLQAWLVETADAVQRWAVPFPFAIHLYMHRRNGAREPVPWANTWRGGEQAIHFHVDPTYPKDAFLADWTAPHEFAHLYLPYLGRDYAWAAEGFASYLQHTLMVELGVITADEAQRRRSAKMDRARARLAESPEPLPDYVDDLRARRDYPSFYWGGAVFWERVDAQLKGRGGSLQSAIRSYLKCCRMQRQPFRELAGTFDEISDSVFFSTELALMHAVPGCPERLSVAGPALDSHLEEESN